MFSPAPNTTNKRDNTFQYLIVNVLPLTGWGDGIVLRYVSVLFQQQPPAEHFKDCIDQRDREGVERIKRDDTIIFLFSLVVCALRWCSAF